MTLKAPPIEPTLPPRPFVPLGEDAFTDATAARYLVARGVDREVAAARGYTVATPNVQVLQPWRDRFGILRLDEAEVDPEDLRWFHSGPHPLEQRAALAVPMWSALHPDGPVSVQLRVFWPPVQPGAKSRPKFVSPSQSPFGERFDAIPQDVHPLARAALLETACPIVLTEGIPKADAILSAALPEGLELAVIATTGVDIPAEARGDAVAPRRGTLWAERPDLVAGREIILAFDADLATNGNVARALDRTAAMLTHAGASLITVLELDRAGAGGTQGIDDVLAGMRASGAPQPLGSLLARRRPWLPTVRGRLVRAGLLPKRELRPAEPVRVLPDEFVTQLVGEAVPLDADATRWGHSDAADAAEPPDSTQFRLRYDAAGWPELEAATDWAAELLAAVGPLERGRPGSHGTIALQRIVAAELGRRSGALLLERWASDQGEDRPSIGDLLDDLDAACTRYGITPERLAGADLDVWDLVADVSEHREQLVEIVLREGPGTQRLVARIAQDPDRHGLWLDPGGGQDPAQIAAVLLARASETVRVGISEAGDIEPIAGEAGTVAEVVIAAIGPGGHVDLTLPMPPAKASSPRAVAEALLGRSAQQIVVPRGRTELELVGEAMDRLSTPATVRRRQVATRIGWAHLDDGRLAFITSLGALHDDGSVDDTIAYADGLATGPVASDPPSLAVPEIEAWRELPDAAEHPDGWLPAHDAVLEARAWASDLLAAAPKAELAAYGLIAATFGSLLAPESRPAIMLRATYGVGKTYLARQATRAVAPSGSGIAVDLVHHNSRAGLEARLHAWGHTPVLIDDLKSTLGPEAMEQVNDVITSSFERGPGRITRSMAGARRTRLAEPLLGHPIITGESMLEDASRASRTVAVSIAKGEIDPTSIERVEVRWTDSRRANRMWWSIVRSLMRLANATAAQAGERPLAVLQRLHRSAEQRIRGQLGGDSRLDVTIARVCASATASLVALDPDYRAQADRVIERVTAAMQAAGIVADAHTGTAQRILSEITSMLTDGLAYVTAPPVFESDTGLSECPDHAPSDLGWAKDHEGWRPRDSRGFIGHVLPRYEGLMITGEAVRRAASRIGMSGASVAELAATFEGRDLLLPGTSPMARAPRALSRSRMRGIAVGFDKLPGLADIAETWSMQHSPAGPLGEVGGEAAGACAARHPPAG